MKELKRELGDGSELIWSTVSSYVHRWRPDKAVLLDEYDHVILVGSKPTHVELYLAENGSLVHKRYEEVCDDLRIEYWVHAPHSQDAIWDLLRREEAGTLDGRGKELLAEYGQALELA